MNLSARLDRLKAKRPAMKVILSDDYDTKRAAEDWVKRYPQDRDTLLIVLAPDEQGF